MGRAGNGAGAPPAHPQGSDRSAPPPLQARRWAQALRDIEDPLKDLTAVKRGVRGLLDVCKNGAPPPAARCRLPLPPAQAQRCGR